MVEQPIRNPSCVQRNKTEPNQNEVNQQHAFYGMLNQFPSFCLDLGSLMAV